MRQCRCHTESTSAASRHIFVIRSEKGQLDDAVATDAIRQGNCNVQNLALYLSKGPPFEANEAAQAVASAIRLDRHLRTKVFASLVISCVLSSK
jgi:hypothetical protein